MHAVPKPPSRTQGPAELKHGVHASIQGDRGQRSVTRVRARDDMPAFWRSATIMRGEPGYILIAEASLVVANPRGSHEIMNTQLGQRERTGVRSVMLLAATIGDLLASEEVAVAFTLPVEDCIGLLGAMGERTHEKSKYPRMLDERAGAAAVVAAEEHPHGNLE